jgi:hypothetical protein
MAMAAVQTRAESVTRARKICVLIAVAPHVRPPCPDHLGSGNPQIVAGLVGIMAQMPAIMARTSQDLLESGAIQA